MTSIKISSQKALAVIRRDKGNDPIDKAMSNILLAYLKNEHEMLLRTGAKLILVDNEIYISGYAQDGNDVNYYFKRNRTKKG